MNKSSASANGPTAEWPYGEKPTYVFTRGEPGGDHPRVKFVSSDAGTLVEVLRQ